MKDYLFYNTTRDKVNLNRSRGYYNIFLLCRKGLVYFRHTKGEFEAKEGDLVVWPSTKVYNQISISDDTDADVLLVSNSFLKQYEPDTIWGTLGNMVLDTHPVFHLEYRFLDEPDVIENDFKQIKQRIFNQYDDLFGEEVIGTLLRVTLYDIWSIFYRIAIEAEQYDLPLSHFAGFLYEAQGSCMEHRDVAWYASMMDITPKYLTELSNSVTGHPAGYWIDKCTARILRKELSAQKISFTEIAEKMKFSSLPAFSRYVYRVLGCSPTEFRSSLKK